MADQQRTGLGVLLQACGQVDRGTDQGLRILGTGAQRRRAGMQTGPHRQVLAAQARRHLQGMGLRLGQQRLCRAHGTQRVVVGRLRQAEGGFQAVAHEAQHLPAMLLHDLREAPQCAVQYCVTVLGVQRLQQPGGVDDVNEQNTDLAQPWRGIRGLQGLQTVTQRLPGPRDHVLPQRAGVKLQQGQRLAQAGCLVAGGGVHGAVACIDGLARVAHGVSAFHGASGPATRPPDSSGKAQAPAARAGGAVMPGLCVGVIVGGLWPGRARRCTTVAAAGPQDSLIARGPGPGVQGLVPAPNTTPTAGGGGKVLTSWPCSVLNSAVDH